MSGYSILEARSLEAATQRVGTCPGLGNDAITVCEAVEFGP